MPAHSLAEPMPAPLALERAERWLFAALALAHLIPIWAVDLLGVTDLARHSVIAQAWAALTFGGDAAVIHDYYELNPYPVPNWIVYPVLAGLMALFSPGIAEKLVLSGIILGLPFAARFAVTGVNPRQPYAAWLAFPFVYNFPFNMGFLNFCISTVFFLLFLGYYFRHYRNFTIPRAAVLGLLGLLVYFSHIVAMVVLGVVLAVFCVWLLAADLLASRGAPAAPIRSAVRYALLPLLGLLPAILLMAAYFADHHAGTVEAAALDIGYRLRSQVALGSVHSHGDGEIPFLMLTSLTFGALALGALMRRFRQGGPAPFDGIAVAALALAGIALVAPLASAGGSYILERLQLFPWFLLMLWLAAQPWPRLLRAVAPSLAAAAALGIAVQHWAVYRQAEPYLHEFRSAAELIEPESTVWKQLLAGWSETPEGDIVSDRIIFLAQAVAGITAGRPLVDLNNYQTAHNFFPVRYRPERDPFRHFDPQTIPPDLGFADYAERSGGRIDYILVWGPEAVEERPYAEAFFARLAQDYEFVAASEPNGYLRIYRHNDITPTEIAASDPEP